MTREGRGRRHVQKQARALGDPTRFAIFQHVAAAPGPVRVATLADEFQLNHNAVRQHLGKLCEAGLLVEDFAPRTGPGRPALQYRPAAGVRGTWATQGPYEQLAMMLLALAVEGGSPRDVGDREGRRAAALVDSARDTPLGLLMQEMQRRGFEPHAVEDGPEADVVLDYCPYAEAAVAEPGIVCEIHRGLAEGFLVGVGAAVQVIGLTLRNPEQAGCRLHLAAVGSRGGPP